MEYQQAILANAWEDLPGYANVYLYARLDDQPGSGQVTIDVLALAKCLDLSPRTCRDYLRRCRQHGYFYRLRWENHTLATV